MIILGLFNLALQILFLEANTFAEDFSNGYLLGEVLFKYQLQDDFDQFSQNRTSESKLNNFTRVEPILSLLGIPFDTNRAREIMTERHGEATKLLYQLFIALNKKQKTGLTGTAMETMRPAAPAKLDYMKSLIYKEVRLKSYCYSYPILFIFCIAIIFLILAEKFTFN